jgi:hypothetical protein
MLFFLKENFFQMDFFLHLLIVFLHLSQVLLLLVELKGDLFLKIFAVLLAFLVIFSLQNDFFFRYFIFNLQDISLCLFNHAISFFRLIFSNKESAVKILSKFFPLPYLLELLRIELGVCKNSHDSSFTSNKKFIAETQTMHLRDEFVIAPKIILLVARLLHPNHLMLQAEHFQLTVHLTNRPLIHSDAVETSCCK